MVGKADGVVEGFVGGEGARGGWVGMVVGGVEGVVLRFSRGWGGAGLGLGGWVMNGTAWYDGIPTHPQRHVFEGKRSESDHDGLETCRKHIPPVFRDRIVSVKFLLSSNG